MLVFSRKKSEQIVINEQIVVTVVEIRGDKIRLGVEYAQRGRGAPARDLRRHQGCDRLRPRFHAGRHQLTGATLCVAIDDAERRATFIRSEPKTVADRTHLINEFLAETARLLDCLDRTAIDRAVSILVGCYQTRGSVFTMGNGGSASTAQHFACDLGKYVIPRGGTPFDVRCLVDNVSLYTAWANDAPREDVFLNQLRGLLAPGDVVLAISVHGGSGFSADLVRAVRYANQVVAQTISLVGFDGGVLRRESACSIIVPVESTPQTEGIHLVIEHLLMSLIRGELSDSR